MNPMEFIERAACWAYVRGKLAFLMGRFPGQIIMTKAFRRPFYCRVSATGRINVAERTSFNYGCVLIAHERIDIGKGCLFGPNVHVYDFDHGMAQDGTMYRDQPTKTSPVRIGDNVWLGRTLLCSRASQSGIMRLLPRTASSQKMCQRTHCFTRSVSGVIGICGSRGRLQ